MSRLKRFWSADVGIWLGLWLALLALGRTQFFRDPGTLWHTVMGQRLLNSGRLTTTDPFSFTFAGRAWIPHEWLAEWGMGVFHATSGWDGLLLVTATALACLYAWVGQRLIGRGLHWLPTTLILILTIAASDTSFHVRPHVASIVGLGITAALLMDFEAGRISLRRLGWLIPLFVVWTNIHGAVLGGMAILAMAALGWVGACLVGLESPVRTGRQAAWLGLLLAACGLTVLVNPYGVRLPATWLEIMGSPVVPRLIIEHAPPSPRSAEFWMILALGLVYAAVFVGTLPRWPRVTWLIPFVWLGLALGRVRHAPLFGITAVVLLAEILPDSRVAGWLARPGRDLFRWVPGALTPVPEPPRRNWRPWVVPVFLVLVAATFQVANVRVPLVGRGWAGLDPTVWPVELLPALQEAEREHPEGARVFNDYALGGFLIYHTPRLKVFIDDRCEVYGDDWLEQFDRASTTDPSLMVGWLAEYEINYVLVSSGSVFDRQIARQPGWSLVQRCAVASFYGRVPAGSVLSRSD